MSIMVYYNQMDQITHSPWVSWVTLPRQPSPYSRHSKSKKKKNYKLQPKPKQSLVLLQSHFTW